MWSFLIWIFGLFNSSNDIEELKIRSQVYIKCINYYLTPDHISIDKIDDILDGKNLNILVERLWSDKIEIDIDPNLKEKEKKIENMHQVLQYLRTKNVNIPDYKLVSLIEKKNIKDLLKILWSIFSQQKIDNIYFNGFKGRKGLLMYVNKLADKKFSNFTDSWDNGKTMCKILSLYYQNDINLSAIEQMNNINYTISILQKVNAPLLFDYEYFNDIDENSIMLQYAILFEFLTLPFQENLKCNESFINHYKANYLYSIYDNKFFYDGLILDKDLPNYINDNNQVVQKINEHFNILMHSRKPVQVASIKKDGNDFKIEYNISALENVLKRAGDRPIIFNSGVGRYQVGKTLINSGITGNFGFEVGNGHTETTKGVYIDGPYDINYLYDRFDVSMRKNIYFGGNDLLSPYVYFFDIEGYEGIMHGNDIEKNNKVFIEMCTPFLCLSSVFIFFSEPKANSIEIKNFFERVKVSKLTTYSNDNSNGGLELHIVFNKYNKILNKLNEKRPNIKQTIEKFQKQMSEEWIGAKPLKQYGIKYNFYPIIDGLPPYYKNGRFFDFFRYFAKSIIRSIENAAEKNFIRNAKQSIDLFNFIVEHQNDESFESMIKVLIKSVHENSFESFSKIAYHNSKRKTFDQIEKEFTIYQVKNIFDINIDDIKENYIKIGEEMIKDYLKVIQDHESVFNDIENLTLSITNKVFDEYENLMKYKEILNDEFNVKIDQKADVLTSNSLDKIQSDLISNENFNFNSNKIYNCIKNEITIIGKDLYNFKQKENLFLISNQKIQTIIIEKQLYLENNVYNYIHKEKIIADQIREENDMKVNLKNIYKKKLKEEYNSKEMQLINDLKVNLGNATFYANNFKRIIEMCQQTQAKIKDCISSNLKLIIYNIIDNLNQQNENNSIIIERLKQKNELNLDEIILDSLIDENKDKLYLKINTEFQRARLNLMVPTPEKRTVEISWLKEKVEVRTTKVYPDGKKEEGEWEEIRIQNKSFGELASSFVDPLIQSIKKIKNIYNDL